MDSTLKEYRHIPDTGSHADTVMTSELAGSTVAVQTASTVPITIQITVAVIAVFAVVIVVLTCIVCMKKRKKKRAKKRSHEAVLLNLRRPSPFSIIPTPRQHNGNSQFKHYNAFQVVNERPQFSASSDKTDNGGKLKKNKRSNSNPKPAPSLVSHTSLDKSEPRPTPVRRTKSLASLTSPLLESKPCEFAELNVAISLKFVKKSKQLHLTLHSATGLPSKVLGHDTYAVVNLFPRTTDGIQSKFVLTTTTALASFEENFLFDDLTLDEVEKSTLRISLNYRKRQKSTKDGFLGEMFLKCCDVDWSKEEAVRLENVVYRNRDKRESTSEKYLFQDMGSLFVLLEYQSAARRMKVLIRKACNLPKSDRLIGQPAHYVIINLTKGTSVIKTQETRAQSGFNPVWNQPFLFDMPGSDVSDYSIEFVIMRGKIKSKDGVIGHVVIGNEGAKSGHQHWKDLMSSRQSDMGRWHNIVPLFNFKAKNDQRN